MPHKNNKQAMERHKKYMKEVWYPKNRQKHIEYVTKQKAKAMELVEKLKDQPCADCGDQFPRVAMDFDHVRGKKIMDLSRAARRGWGEAKILAEAAKCDVVCSNCHRVRTLKNVKSKIRDVYRAPE